MLACGLSNPADTVPASTAGAPASTAAASATTRAAGQEGPEVVVAEPPPPLVFPEDAGLVDVSAYGAVGDGITDDTAALQRAISDNVGRHRILYFPPGTYLISYSLEWQDEAGDWEQYLTLQGAGRGHTTIRLADAAAGFGDMGSPRAAIVTASGLLDGDPYSGGKDWPELGEGNQAFRNYIFDLTVETGAKNPGAIGIDFLGNNISGVENVTIRSGDGSGRAGLSMTRKWPGPSLIKNVEIVGFDYGIEAAHTEYGITFEDIVLRDQHVAAIRNTGNVLSMHRVTSTNQAPAILNESPLGLVTLIDASLNGGSAGAAAIENAGAVFLRSVTSEGYGSVVDGVAGTEIDEFAAPLTEALGGRSLGLPIVDPPPVDRHVPLDSWTSVTDPAHAGGADPTDEEDDTAAIQGALDSGAPVVYFPSTGDPSEGRYLVSRTLVVPEHVARIVGFESLILGARGSVFTEEDATQAVFRIEGSAPAGASLRIEGFRMARQDEPLLGAIWFDHASPRPLTLRHVQAGGGAQLSYRGSAGSGSLFLEDVCCDALALGAQQRVWARQLNVEKPSSPMVTNAGAQLWVLGIKTERPHTVVVSTDVGATELLGGLLYPVEPVPDEVPAFVTVGTPMSLVYAVSAHVDDSRNYDVHVLHDRGRLTGAEVVGRDLGSLVPLYVAD